MKSGFNENILKEIFTFFSMRKFLNQLVRGKYLGFAVLFMLIQHKEIQELSSENSCNLTNCYY